mmetsp:Transcript_11658/g.34652  ORF Transcript_11658/g.34652 Transcript_11658/m.34652 type:complete len:216 (-) Transcript_11658:472-1119(-)
MLLGPGLVASKPFALSGPSFHGLQLALLALLLQPRPRQHILCLTLEAVVPIRARLAGHLQRQGLCLHCLLNRSLLRLRWLALPRLGAGLAQQRREAGPLGVAFEHRGELLPQPGVLLALPLQLSRGLRHLGLAPPPPPRELVPVVNQRLLERLFAQHRPEAFLFCLFGQRGLGLQIRIPLPPHFLGLLDLGRGLQLLLSSLADARERDAVDHDDA